jgi:hypothetical protein
MSKQNSDYNLTTISTVQYAELVRSTIEYGGNCFVVGRRGSGKTIIAEDIIKESGHDLFFWNVSTLERVDTAGFPDIASVARKDDYVKYILSEKFRALLEGNRPVVAMLDEVDKADKEIHASLLEFLQNKSINGRKFKNLKSIIMTGNLPSEGGRKPISPLLDRTEKYLLEAKTNHWIEWGSSKGKIHPSCLAFLTDHPSELQGEINSGELYADSSPRMWEETSKITKYGEAHRWSPELIALKASGCLGKSTSIKYSAYFDYYQVLMPLIEDILKGKDIGNAFDSAMHPGKKITTIIILGTRVAALLDEMEEKKRKEIPVEVRNVGKFLMGIDRELALVGIRSGIGKDRMLKHLFAVPEYDKIMSELVERMSSKRFKE